MKISINGIFVLLLFLMSTGVAMASPVCNTVIHSNDKIQWDTDTINVSKACEVFTIALINDGFLDKSVMGHNWVLTKREDSDDVARSLVANKHTDYIKDDPRIIAHTKLLGGGQVDTITFSVDQLQEGQEYSFFCSYPEHIDLMRGSLELVE